MKKLFTTCTALLLALCLHEANAQIGINTMNPDPNAVLDIQSADKGIKLPSIKSTAVLTVPQDSAGYLIFHSTDKKFRYWNGEYWERLNPVGADSKDNIVTTDSMYLNKHVKGNGNTNIELTNGEFIGNGTIPVGGIIMWNGTTIPKGWALCDGFWYNPNNNNDKGNSITSERSIQTPDLRGRFIVGFVNEETSGNSNDSKYTGGKNDAINSQYSSLGANGGASAVTLQLNQMPTHNHDILDYGHNHTITGEVMQKEGSSTQQVVALDTEGDVGHGYKTYSNKIGKGYTGTETRNSGGDYTYTPEINPPKIIPGCTVFEYTCTTDNGFSFSCNSRNLGTKIEINGDQSYQLPWAPDFSGYQICIEGKYYCGLGYANTNYATGTVTSCVVNSNYSSITPDCINDIHDPRVDVGKPIRINEKWVPQSHENRPPYYVLAFIMRIK